MTKDPLPNREELLTRSWPSAGAASMWLRRRGTSADKLGLIIGMHAEQGVGLFEHSAADTVSKPSQKPAAKPAAAKISKPAKVVRAKPSKPSPVKPTERPPLKADSKASPSLAVTIKAFELAKREEGIPRREVRAMNGGQPPYDWEARIERYARKHGWRFHVSRPDGYHPVFKVRKPGSGSIAGE